MFHTADPEDILDGKITDVYFERSLRILRAEEDKSGCESGIYS